MESRIHLITSVSACAALTAFVCAVTTELSQTNSSLKGFPNPTQTPKRFFEEMCDLLVGDVEDDGDLDMENVLDGWLVEFGWNLVEQPYLGVGFRKVDETTVERFKRNMRKYLIAQPDWESAVCLMTLFRPTRDVMLFRGKGPPGRFVGVPDYVRYDPFVIIPKKSVPLFETQLLLVGPDKPENYLVISDCGSGETYLTRRDNLRRIYAPEVYHAALRVPFPIRYSSLFTGVALPEIPMIQRSPEVILEFPFEGN